eukprot:5180285-Amphidinium_carterae.2
MESFPLAAWSGAICSRLGDPMTTRCSTKPWQSSVHSSLVGILGVSLTRGQGSHGEDEFSDAKEIGCVAANSTFGQL